MVNGVELRDSQDRTETKPLWHLVKYAYESEDLQEIEIHFLNKEPGDTKVVNGEITEDLLLVIEQLSIDGLDLTNKISKISNYVDTEGKRHYTHTYITFNGCMKIKMHKNLLYTDWLAGLI